MRIDLTKNIDFYIEEGELEDIEIYDWFSMNKKFIENLIIGCIRNYGWAFGGAPEMYLDLKKFYREHPYNLEEKYRGELSPTTYSLLMAA